MRWRLVGAARILRGPHRRRRVNPHAKERDVMRTIGTATLVMLLTSCTASTAPAPARPAGHQAGEEAAVLAAFDRYLTAISAKDLAAMAAMQMPDGMTYQARATKDAGMRIQSRPNAFWVDSTRAGGPPMRERYWSPTVLVRGSIAVVWAPYEFWVDGRTSHCGVDVFDFVRVDGAWRVSNAMWTAEPDACDELRPADRGALRPADPR
jgi:hypothetical protein